VCLPSASVFLLHTDNLFNLGRSNDWNLVYSNLFRVFGASPGSEEASTLEASKSPNMYDIDLLMFCGLFSLEIAAVCLLVITLP